MTISTCTAYNFALAYEDKRIYSALSSVGLLVADGMPLVWIQQRLRFRQAQRMYRPDIYLKICQATTEQRGPHYFYGGRSGVTQHLSEYLVALFPGLDLGGYAEPQTSTELNRTDADIIWVGLWSPLQDLWMQAYRPLLYAPLLIGVGAALDFLSGSKRQAPRFIQHSGCEWLFRLLHEPKRLGQQYLIYDSCFVVLILKWTLRTHGTHPL